MVSQKRKDRSTKKETERKKSLEKTAKVQAQQKATREGTANNVKGPKKQIGSREVSSKEYRDEKEGAQIIAAGGRKARTKEELIEAGAIKEEPKQSEMAKVLNEIVKNNEEVTGGMTKVREEEKTTIDTETITHTDELGNVKEIQMPIGTTAKIAEANARREGRVPFGELPKYQQYLAGTAALGVSPGLLTSTGKGLKVLSNALGKVMTTTVGKYVGGVVTFSGIMTWLASDNIIGTMSIYGRDLAEDVTFGKLSADEALTKFDEGAAFVEQGRNFIRTATILNPLLWPFRKIILANADAAELALEENRNRILRNQ